MKAICKRNFLSLFQNVVGWLFSGVLLALYGLYFTAYNLRGGYPTLSYTITGVTFLFLIAAPILTMQSMAGEKKNKTDRLLLTSPVSVAEIVLGKYLALVAAFSIVVLVICVSPLIMAQYGEVNFVQNYVAILGFWLYGCTCLAIGLLISALVENQALSAILTFVVLFLGYMMSSVTGALSASENWLTNLLNGYDLISPLTNLLSGNLELSDIIYYLSFTALVLFLAGEVLLWQRWSIRNLRPSLRSFSVTSIAIAVAAFILINLGFSRLPSGFASLDVTTQKLYTLSEETISYLQGLEEDVTVYAIGQKEGIDDVVTRMLSNYEATSDHITVAYVDPAANPTFASTYLGEGEDPENGTLIVVGSEAVKEIPYDTMYETEFDYATYSQNTVGYDGEGQLTSALSYVTDAHRPVIYELEGHDETPLSESYQDVVEKANTELSAINLLTSDAIPKDCEGLFIHAPQSDFSEEDVAHLTDYINAGGDVCLTLDFSNIKALSNVADLMAAYGVHLKDGLVADFDRDYYYQIPYYLLPFVDGNEITADISGTASVLAPYSLAFSYDEEKEAFSYTPLLITSDAAVLKKDITGENVTEVTAGAITKEDGDEEGPFTVGLLIRTDGGGSLCLLGSSYVFTETANNYVSGRNANLFTDVLAEMLPEDAKSGVVIPVKAYELSYLTTTANAVLVFGLFFGILLPLVAIVVGILIWGVRRRR